MNRKENKDVNFFGYTLRLGYTTRTKKKENGCEKFLCVQTKKFLLGTSKSISK